MTIAGNIVGIGNKGIAAVWNGGTKGGLAKVQSVQLAPRKPTPFLGGEVQVKAGTTRTVAGDAAMIGNPGHSPTVRSAQAFHDAVAAADLTRYPQVKLGSAAPRPGQLLITTDVGGAPAFAAIPRGKEPNIRNAVNAFHEELRLNGVTVRDR